LCRVGIFHNFWHESFFFLVNKFIQYLHALFYVTFQVPYPGV
jgi:hypothetical protein